MALRGRSAPRKRSGDSGGNQKRASKDRYGSNSPMPGYHGADKDHMVAAFAAFQRFDLNGDNVISHSELRQVLQELDSNLWPDKKVNQLLLAMDTNNDGIIDYTELLHWIFASATAADRTALEKVSEMPKPLVSSAGECK